jgi:hypothetical protein
MSIIKRLLDRNKGRRDERRLKERDRKILRYLKSLVPGPSTAQSEKRIAN